MSACARGAATAWAVAGVAFASFATFATFATFASAAGAQEAPEASQAPQVDVQSSGTPGSTPEPSITPGERIHWIVNGVVGPKSTLAVGPFSSAWYTARNSPEEWGRTWSGFGKRYLVREANVAISGTLEAGLGAIWGEDPRFVPSPRRGMWPRVRFALKTVVLAPRRDGHLAPAWGRYAGNTINVFIVNSWLPPSATTRLQTALSIATGFGGQLAGNLFNEFWPDVWHHTRKRRRP